MFLNSFVSYKKRKRMSHVNRQKLKLPEAHGLKALEIDAHSAYLRWAFLSTHSLSKDQLRSLMFEIKTTDNSLNAQFNYGKLPKHEFKARLMGLKANTKYRFQIRCKLKHRHEMIYSSWSNRIELTTKVAHLTVITNEENLKIQSLKHKIDELKQKITKLEQQNLELGIRLHKFQPPHHEWNYRKIVEWIMRIQNGLFKPYKQTLLDSLKQEQVDGKCLCQITLQDLHRFGVTKFAHKKILMNHIHKLTENDKLPEYQYNHELAQTITTPQSMMDKQQKSRYSEEELVTEDEEGGDEKTNNFLPSQNKRYRFPTPPPPSTSSDYSNSNSNNNIPYKPGITKNGTKIGKSDNENKSNDDSSDKNDILSHPLTMDNIGNYSAGLTKSVKDMLMTSPSDEPPKTWKYKNGVLSIKVVKATNVDNMDADDLVESNRTASDPYVELELRGHYKKEKTKVIYNDANPIWNERFQLFPENPKKDVLKCKIWDKDTWTFDDKIGSVWIPVIDVLNANGVLNKAFDIRGSKTGAQLYLELRYKELEH